jgi:energy-coupling factor transporter ATP-binding protein EcfA2
MIGPNGCGKSTVVDALALIFGRERIVRTLTEHDFSGSDPKPAQRIRLTATVAGFPGNEPDQNENWFRDGRAVDKWWCTKDRSIRGQKAEATDVLCAQIGFAARFDQETLSVETIRYFHDDDSVADPFDEGAVTLVPGRLLSEVGFFVVPSTRTWDRVGSFDSEIFRRIIKELEGLPSEEILKERDRLRTPEEPFKSIGELKEIVTRINAEFGRIVPGQPQFQLRVTSTDSDSLLHALVPHYKYGETVSLPAIRHGTGLLSLQTLILLLEFGRARKAKGKNFILAIEEPELHLPPPLQRRAIFRAQAATDQTICTSHAPNIASYYPAMQIRVLENRKGQLKSLPLLAEGLTAESAASLRKLYLDNRFHLVEALMHSNLLVPEGRIDFEWLRLLSDCAETAEAMAVGPPEDLAFGTTVGVIPTHNASLADTFRRLSALRTDITVLVDGDNRGMEYVKELLKGAIKPRCIIQWPKDWAIEDVVGWILEADAAAVLPKINQYVAPKAVDLGDLLQRWKKDTKSGGLKTDYLAYQEIAGAIRDSENCMQRVRLVLASIRDVTQNRIAADANLEKDAASVEDCNIVRWKP